MPRGVPKPDPVVERFPWIIPQKYIPIDDFAPVGPGIPKRELTIARRHWEDWVYGVILRYNMESNQGSVRLYREGRRKGTAQVAGYQEAERIFETVVAACKEVTAEIEQKLDSGELRLRDVQKYKSSKLIW